MGASAAMRAAWIEDLLSLVPLNGWLTDEPIWAGWAMILALIYRVIPPVILGRMKLKLAADLLACDAKMSKADWMTGTIFIAPRSEVVTTAEAIMARLREVERLAEETHWRLYDLDVRPVRQLKTAVDEREEPAD